MDKEKRNNYSLVAGIHTVQLITSEEILVPEKMKGISCSIRNRNSRKYSSIKINANYFNGDIWAFQEFQETLQCIIDTLGISDYRIVRADLRFDSNQEDFYLDYWKLHKYLLSGLAYVYKVKNTYLTNKLISDKKTSLSVKDRLFQIEYYDKVDESAGTSSATARLEERSKAGSNASLEDLATEFCCTWKERWEQVLINLTEVQDKYNRIMIPDYYDKVDHRGLKLNEFLLLNADKFFTRRQLINFIKTVEIKNPEYAADNFVRRYGDKCDIEFFSQKDCREVIGKITSATNAFFNNEFMSEMTQKKVA